MDRRRFLSGAAGLTAGLAVGRRWSGVATPTRLPVTHDVTGIAALQAAIDAASAGDTIVLADGTYLDTALSIGVSGITVRSATPGGVHLNGTNSITISGSQVTFSGFQFTSGSIAGIVITVSGNDNLLTQLNFDGYSAQKYINIQAPSQRNVIAFCNFRNKPITAPPGNLVHIGADPSVVGYHKVRYCSFRDIPGAGGDNGNEPIRLSNGAESTYVARTVIEYCYWSNTGGGDSEAVSVKCRENLIRHCTFTNNQNAMLVFRNGDDNAAYGNFFINAGGIRVKEANNISCSNNYFENSGVGGTADAVTLDYVSPNLANIAFVHNTFVECGKIDLGGPGPTNNTWANNVFTKSSGSIFVNPNAGAAWAGNMASGALGITIPSGMTVADPQLVRNADGYYGLSSTSPAIDAASASYPSVLDIVGVDDDPTLLFDISGQTRPATRTLKDVGCDEYAVGGTVNRPLTLADVGPSYLGGPGGVPPAITTQPQSRSVGVGSSVSFTVVATGSAPLAYQWRRNGSSITGATGATYTIASAQAGDAGSYTVIVSNAAGTVVSAAASLTVIALPAPWATTDIGPVGIAGSASTSTGTYTIKGSGTGLGGGTDQFRYVYQTLYGDGSVTARLTGQSGTLAAAVAGVMIRESTATGAKFAAMVRRGSGTKNLAAVRRSSTGGSTTSTTATSQTPPNCWVQVIRTGNSLAMRRSADGANWATVATSTISMAATITLGLVVASGSNSVLDTDLFTNVTVVT